jgi:hypothetical protein
MSIRVRGTRTGHRWRPARSPTTPFPLQLRLVVCTMRTKYDEAYRKLMESMANVGVPANSIITVYGGEPHESVMHNAVNLRHNLYEYNAFVGASVWCKQRPAAAAQTRAFLLMHDTCDIGGAFVAKVAQFFKSHARAGSDVSWACTTGQCNICLFSRRAAQAFHQRFHDRLGMDKHYAIDMEWNADNGDSVKSFRHLKQVFDSQPALHAGQEAVYSSRQPRQVLYFPLLDLTKYYVALLDGGPAHPNAP